MSCAPRFQAILCIVALSAGIAKAGPAKSKVARSIATEPQVIRIVTDEGMLVFERTADSPILRGDPQSWIALWQRGAKEPFYVF